jgi:hypothetical protein
VFELQAAAPITMDATTDRAQTLFI